MFVKKTLNDRMKIDWSIQIYIETSKHLQKIYTWQKKDLLGNFEKRLLCFIIKIKICIV